MRSAAKVKPGLLDEPEYPHAEAHETVAVHEVSPGVYGLLRMPLCRSRSITRA